MALSSCIDDVLEKETKISETVAGKNMESWVVGELWVVYTQVINLEIITKSVGIVRLFWNKESSRKRALGGKL